MAKLWEIAGKMGQFVALIEEIQESDLTPEEKDQRLNHTFEGWLEIQGTFEEKLLAIAGYIRQQKAILEAQSAEVKRVSLLAARTEEGIERLKNYMKGHMEMNNVKSAKDALGSVSLRKNRASVVITVDPETIPEDYITVKTHRSPDKKAIEDAVKAGQIDWAELRSTGNHLIIK